MKDKARHVILGLSVVFALSAPIAVAAPDKAPPDELVRDYFPPKDDLDNAYPRLFLDRKVRLAVLDERIKSVSGEVARKRTIKKAVKRVRKRVCTGWIDNLQTGRRICIY